MNCDWQATDVGKSCVPSRVYKEAINVTDCLEESYMSKNIKTLRRCLQEPLCKMEATSIISLPLSAVTSAAFLFVQDDDREGDGQNSRHLNVSLPDHETLVKIHRPTHNSSRGHLSARQAKSWVAKFCVGLSSFSDWQLLYTWRGIDSQPVGQNPSTA
ncbi:uncharacterized protein ACBT44_015163 [Syngnathus typhle]